MPERIFLGKKQLLAKSAAAGLARFRDPEKLSDLGQILLVLPGELARKNIQRELPELFPGGLLLPQLLTPHRLLHFGRPEKPHIPAVMDEILWGRTLAHAAGKKEQFRQLFPGGKVPTDFFAASKMLRTFRDELYANGFSIADAAPHLGGRGAELAQLEKIYLQHLAENNFPDPLQYDRQAANDIAAFADVSRIILAGLPDLPVILKEKLANIDREFPGKIEIWIGDDESAADNYDQWGIPLAEVWMDKAFEIPLKNIHLALDPVDAARRAMTLSGDPACFAPENCTVVLSDPALYKDFAREFSRMQLPDGRPLPVADPSGMPFGALRIARLADLLLPVLNDPDNFPAVMELFREADFLSCCCSSSFAGRMLQLLDEFQQEFTPDSRRAALLKISGIYAPLLQLNELLEWILDRFAHSGVPEFLRELFTRIFRRSEIEPCCGVSFDRECDVFNAQLRMLEELPEKITAYPDKIKLMEIFFRCCRDLPVPVIIPENALTFEGRLEMPFLTAKRVIFCGMNESYFPDKIDLTPYLTDTLRRKIGMRSNRETLARSMCHLFSAAASRDGDDFQIIVLKQDSKHSALAPSKILFNGSNLPENELLDRCGKLFNDPSAPPEIFSIQQNKIFRLKPQLDYRKTEDTLLLSVTDLDEYLKNPFDFFWNRVLKSDNVDYEIIEPDSRKAGTFCHKAFEALGCRKFTSVKQLRDRLQAEFDQVLADHYGELPAMVKIYAANMKQRLNHAAETLFEEQEQGFETLAVEYRFGGNDTAQLPFAGAIFKGTIDRIEYNRALKIIRIVDIKTGSVKNVVDEHCTVHLVFKRLQLPLYALLLARDPYFKEHLCPEIDECRIECAYLHLSRSVSDIRMHIWEYDRPDDPRALIRILPLAEQETFRIVGEIMEFSRQKLYTDPQKLKHPLLLPNSTTALTGIEWMGSASAAAQKKNPPPPEAPAEKRLMPQVNIPSLQGSTRCCHCPLHKSGCQCFHGDCSDCKCFNGFKAYNIITASAGTGKTYSLASRYLQLLDFGVKPEDILAITFTRKATAEILDRIVKRICDMIREPGKTGNFCRRIDRTRLLDHLRMLLASGEKEPQISTIDSFFMQLLKVLAPELGIWGEISMIDENDQRPIRETIRTWVNSIDDETQLDILRELLKDANASEEKNFFASLRELITEVYPCYLLDLAKDDDGTFPQLENFPWRPASSDVMPQELCMETEEALGEWSDNADFNELTVISSRSRTTLQRRMRALSEELAKSRNGSLFGKLNEDTKKLLEELTKGNPPDWCDAPDDAELWYIKKQLPAELAQILRRSTRHIRALACLQMVRKNRAVFELMEKFDRLYSKLVRNTGKLTFDDPPALLCHLDPETREMVLGGDDHMLEMRLDSQISHYMFDEFQDTSDIQFQTFWPLLKELFSQQDGDRFRSFFCVGDIKQSIYQWRNGNPELFSFLTAQLKYTVGDQYDPCSSLSCSYRSAQVIMDTVNAVFSEPYSGDNPGFEAARKRMKYLPHYSGVELDGHSAVIEVPPENKNQNIPAKARIISGILKEISPFQRDLTVGILVRTNSSAQDLAEELRKISPLPISVEGKISPAQSMAFNVFKELLTLANHPGDREAANFLDNLTFAAEDGKTELCGRENIARKMGFDPEIPLADSLRHELFVNGIAAVTRRFTDAYAGEVTAEERRYLEILLRLADNFNGSADDFLRQMPKAGEAGSSLKNTVQIMTFHKSKGLEFDIVFLPDCGNHNSGNNVPLTPEFENITSGEVQYAAPLPRPAWASYLPVKEIANNIPPFRQYLKECDEIKAFEKCCNLYVAMTRAKHALYMLVSCGQSTTSLAPDMLLRERLSFYGAQNSDLEWSKKLGTAEYPATLHFSHGDRLWYGKFHALKKSISEPEKFHIPAFAPPEITVTRTASSTKGERHKKPAERFAPVSGVEYGTMIHELFARLEWVDENFDEKSFCAGMPQTVMETFTMAMAKDSAVRELLTRKPDDECEVWLERRFLVKNPAGEIVPGAFDRVVIRKEQGKISGAEIIDYKSDRMGKREDFTIYFPQLESYRRSLAILLDLPEEKIRCRICALRLKEVIDTV